MGSNLRLVGVLPEPVAEAQQYLKDERVQLDEIKQIPLDRIDVTGTPTMLLVNSRGIVVQTWL
ncbi:MAG TPA: hypothetical protein VFA65_24035, partial [Bryobacteraceae bacterium]|nr:hypothetical protein [Bryobacteraceae bacterium]